MSVATPSPELAAPQSQRDQLRSKLVSVASQHGIALISRRDLWDACEHALRDAYGVCGSEIHAAVMALRTGIVADLVSWRADGATRVERELTRRLIDRAGVEPELAAWAIESWAVAFKIPLSGEGTSPSLGEDSADPSGRNRDVVIRAPHMILVGALAGLAVAGSVVSGGVARLMGATSDSTAAPAPMTAPPVRRQPQSMARAESSAPKASPMPTREVTPTIRTTPTKPSPSTRVATKDRSSRDSSAGFWNGAMREVRREAQRIADRLAARAAKAQLAESQADRRVDRSRETSLGDIAARMPKQAHSAQAQQLKAPSRKEIEKIRRAFAMTPTPTQNPIRTAPITPMPMPTTAPTGAIQSGAAVDDNPCSDWVPRLRRNYEPSIPSDLQSQGITSGRVLVRFKVDESGIPDAGSARVLETSNSGLVESALNAVERLRYEAAPSGCSATATVERAIRFF